MSAELWWKHWVTSRDGFEWQVNDDFESFAAGYRAAVAEMTGAYFQSINEERADERKPEER